jgi:secondary thiamine-phosphate synthase enzyme
MVVQKSLKFTTPGRGSLEITHDVNNLVMESGIAQGICNLFVLHTSASLMICENADPSVRVDLETVLGRLAPDGDPAFLHTTEGPDDMAAHARTLLTDSSLSLPVDRSCCVLGTWQGIYLWEHRKHPHQRRVLITVFGE